MRILHLALAVSNIEQSVVDYSGRLGGLPVVSLFQASMLCGERRR